MKGKGTTDAIFIVRQMQEKFRAKGKKLYFGFVDLQKAFDSVPTEVIRWAMHTQGDEEWLVSAVMSMYTGARTFVRGKGRYAQRCSITSFAICDCHGRFN